MNRDTDRQKLFTRRALMLAGGQAVLTAGLVGRMYYLGVVDAPRYATLADENRISLRLLPPPRGRILDRHGRPLAGNRQTYRAVIVAEQANGVEATLDTLARLIAIGPGDRERVLREVARKRKFVPVTIREDLSWDEVTRIEVNAPELPGVTIDEGQSRFYPYGGDFAHALGYVAAVAEDETTGDPLLELPGFRIGKSGMERTYDLTLRGSGGRSQVEVNAYGRVIRELSRTEGEPGADIVSTIDLDLQRMASRRLEGESGAVVVMDVHGGEVLALASSPSFDPNAFNRGLRRQEWRELVDNERAPLTNKAISGQYPPGSTFKVAVALAGLERGVISPHTRVFCRGHTRLGSHTFHCWKRGGHGSMNMHEAIVQSCDVYFYEVARRLGVDTIAEMSRRLGLGAPVGIDLPGERPGLMPTRSWKAEAMGQPWHQGETLIVGIGQGYALSTPLQLAVMTARFANGGFQVTPRLTRVDAPSPAPSATPLYPPLGVNPVHIRLICDAMNDVVNGRRGTARGSMIREEGLEMAGKTGTSQVRRITRAERATGIRRNEDLPWHQRHHALFIGYAPVHAPRYALAVVIEHGGGGSTAAAPVARDVLLAAQKLDSLRIAAGPGQTGAPRRTDDDPA
ncbi:MAG: penicillin-binding protein 2 [Rhodospirillales bacterium]|nr:MAG: penicillin-binding protein 2 [Rhodospirillales bacterium]